MGIASALLLALAPAQLPGSSTAALVDEPVVDQFLDIMYLGPRFSPKAEAKGVDMFEAQIAPHLFYTQRVRRLLAPHPAELLPQGWAVVFVPLFRLRMTTDDSNPVRTPSFNPQIATLQLFWAWGALPVPTSNTHDRYDWPHDGGESGWVGLTSLQYTVAHHSNGQQGCTFAGTGERDPSCRAANFDDGRPPANTRDGNYGTNYETIGVFHKWMRLDRSYQQRRAHAAGITWERYEWAPIAGILPGGIGRSQPDKDFKRLFGMHRLTASYELEMTPDCECNIFSRYRAALALTAISSARNVGWRGRAMLDLGATFPGTSGIGLFARVFYGQDYYNIRFQDVAPMAILGISWDTRLPQLFRKPEGEVVSGDVLPPVVPPVPPATPDPESPPPDAPAPPPPVPNGDS